MTGRRVRDVRPISIPGSLYVVLCRGGNETTIRKAKKREPGIGLTFRSAHHVFFNSFLRDSSQHLLYVVQTNPLSLVFQEIDGKALLLMSRNDVLTGMSIKLGPALKIYVHVARLQSQNGTIPS